MLGRLDAFQMRGLRYILKIEHSYYSRISNEEVYEKINIILNKGTDIDITWQEFITANRFDKPKQIVKLSDYVMNQQNKLLGHVIRADPLDPMKQPTINNTLQIPGIYKRRVGRPRLGWVSENCKWIYKKQFHENYDEHNPEHVQKLLKEAKDRNF